MNKLKDKSNYWAFTKAFIFFVFLVGTVQAQNTPNTVPKAKKHSANLDSSSKKIQVGAYYFPGYHVDKQNDAHKVPNFTEWPWLKAAKPRFEGHQQPRIPLWGYEDESLPEVMEKKIDAAVSYGLDYFIFDWYYYDSGIFFEILLLENRREALL